MNYYEMQQLDRKRKFERRVVAAVVWIFVILATAGLAWLTCWSFGLGFRARYLIGAFAIGTIVKMWMTPIQQK